MAGLPTPESQSMLADGSVHEMDPQSSQQAADDVYGEGVVIHNIPTKTGDEETWLYDSDRPLSAGTAHGDELDFDVVQSDDPEAVIAEYGNVQAQSAPAVDAEDFKAEGRLLQNPAVADVPGASEFSFARPPRLPPLNSTPSHHSLATDMLPSTRLDRGRVPHHDGSDALNATVNVKSIDVQDPSQAIDAQRTSQDVKTQQIPQSFRPQDGEQKRKKKRSKTKPLPQASVQEVVNTADYDVSNMDAPTRPGEDDYPHNDAVLFDAKTQKVAHENTEMQDELQVRDGSPHVQLQDDLNAAAQQQQGEVGPSPVAIEAVGLEQDDILPLDHATNHNVNHEPPHPQNDEQLCGVQSAAHLADTTCPPRVQKRKLKSSRKTASAPQAQGTSVNHWRLTDYAKLFQIKAEECESTFASEREALQRNIQQALEAGAATQSELESALDEKQQLTASIGEQQNKVSVYEAKIRSFKTFVEGVGKDLDTLRKDANNLRRRSDDIEAEIVSQGARNFAAHKEMDERINDCRKIKNEALKLAHDRDEEFHRTLLHRDQLQRELDKTVGVLSEERDRCVKLEKQLEESEKKLLYIVKSNHNATLDKLHLIHAVVEDEQSKKDTAETIEQLRSAAQTSDRPENSTIQDIAGIKALIEALDQRLNNNVEAAETAGIDIRTHFDDALKSMQAHLADRESLIERHREAVNGLQEQLHASNNHVVSQEALKTAAQGEVSNLKEQNTALQVKLSFLETKISPAQDSQIRLNEAKMELERNSKALESAKADLKSKSEELEAQTRCNNSLADEVKALQDRLRELQTEDTSSGISQEELERKIREAVHLTQKELGDSCEIYKKEFMTKANSDLKQMTGERNRLEKQVKPLQEQLASCRQELSQMQTDKPTVSEGLKHELERHKKRVQSQKNEIEALQSSLADLEKAATQDISLQERCTNLGAQLKDEASKLQQMTERNSGLQHEINRLDDSRVQIELAKDEACEKLANLRKETGRIIQALEEELAEAKENASQDSAGLERLKASCQETIDKANNTHDRQIKALQNQLSGVQKELETKNDENASMYENVKQAWEKEKRVWEEKTAEKVSEKASEIEAEVQDHHNRALEELQITMDKQLTSMKEENEDLRARLEAAEDRLQSNERSSSKESKASSRLQGPYTKDGIPPKITPTEGVRSTQPSKPPRKPAIDRSKGEIKKLGPIQVPEEIRPNSRRTESANPQATVRGPVVGESQGVSNHLVFDRKDTPAPSCTHSSFAVEAGESFIGHGGETSQPGSQTIPETQAEDSLPTFAGYNNSKGPSRRPSLSTGPSTSDPPHAAVRMARPEVESQMVARSFDTFEQSQQQNELSLPQSQHTRTSVNHQQSQAWSQEENDPYNFHPRVPSSNSKAKRLPSTVAPSTRFQRRGSEPQLESGRFQTPNLVHAVDDMVGNRMSSSHSSSPVFTKQAQPDSKPQRKYSTTPKSVRKNDRNPQLEVGLTTDPRLADRKRKPEIMHGYADERNKRLKNNGRAQSQHPQSMADPHNNENTPRRATTRMQTLAGANPRGRPTRKTSQSSMMNTRFTQAANRR